MNRERWMLLGTLVVFFGVGLSYYPSLRGIGMAGKRSSPTTGTAPVGGPTAPVSPADNSLKGEGLTAVIDEKTPWGRNPFLTEEEAEKGKRSGTELTVKTIISGRSRSVATIDGRTVLVGEMVGEETVVEIRPDAVVLESEGRRRILRVREPAVVVEVKERRK